MDATSVADTSSSAPTTSDGAGSARSALQVLEAIGAVAAPLTVATALAFYIGVQRQQALADGLGVEISVLGLSTQDYVVRSTDTLVRFIATLLVVVVLSVLAVVGFRRLLSTRFSEYRRVAGGAAVVLGSLMLLYAMYRLHAARPLSYGSLLAPIDLMVGTVVLVAGIAVLQPVLVPDATARERRWARTAVLMAATGLVLTGLFWGANDYAYLQGRERALQLEDGIRRLPQAIIYSDTRIHATSDAVREERLPAGDGAMIYRYRGIRLLLSSGGQYIFLPLDWSPTKRRVIVVPHDQVKWIEFTS